MCLDRGTLIFSWGPFICVRAYVCTYVCVCCIECVPFNHHNASPWVNEMKQGPVPAIPLFGLFLQRLTIMISLFPNSFNEKMCDQLLAHLHRWVDVLASNAKQTRRGEVRGLKRTHTHSTCSESSISCLMFHLSPHYPDVRTYLSSLPSSFLLCPPLPAARGPNLPVHHADVAHAASVLLQAGWPLGAALLQGRDSYWRGRTLYKGNIYILNVEWRPHHTPHIVPCLQCSTYQLLQ